MGEAIMDEGRVTGIRLTRAVVQMVWKKQGSEGRDSQKNHQELYADKTPSLPWAKWHSRERWNLVMH